MPRSELWLGCGRPIGMIEANVARNNTVTGAAASLNSTIHILASEYLINRRWLMDLQIKDKVAFVGGGSKGMGRAVAERLAMEGCKVGVVARDQTSIDEVVDHIRSLDGTAIGISADLAS